MPNELRPEDAQELWRNEPKERIGVSLDMVRGKARQLEASTQRGFRITGILMICAALCYALFLYVFPGMLQRIGSSLTLAAYLYCAYQFRKNGPVKKLLAEAPATTCAAYQAELKRLRNFSLVSSLMVPFIPGPAVFVLGFLIPEMGVPKALGLTAALIASPFVLAIPLARRKRQMLDREIESLRALVS